jgi:hypothetical protein
MGEGLAADEIALQEQPSRLATPYDVAPPSPIAMGEGQGVRALSATPIR